MENCTVWKSETTKKVFTNPRYDSTKGNTTGGRRAKPTTNVFVVDAVATAERLQSQDSRQWRTSPNSAGRRARNIEKRARWLIWGLLECCQTTARPQKMMLLLMNLQMNPRGLCRRCHLFPGSRTQGFHGTQKGVAGSFENMAMATTAETAKSPLSRTLGHSMKGCFSVNFHICFVCQKLGVYSQHLPITSLRYDIPSEGDCRPDEVPIEVAPCEEWLLEEVELNTVTINSMSIDSKPVDTDGE